MVSPSIFKVRFPEFVDIDDIIIQMMLDESYLLLSAPNKYQDTLVLYYTAHNLTVQQNQVSGDATSIQVASNESVGNVSVGYANPTIKNTDIAFYMSTSYGQKYLEYKRALCVGNVQLI